MAKDHNDANILSLPARFISLPQALEMVKIFPLKEVAMKEELRRYHVSKLFLGRYRNTCLGDRFKFV